MLDISAAGAGIQLLDISIEEVMEGLIIVNLELQGDMKNAIPWEEDSVRVGVEFPDLKGAAAHYARRLRSYDNRMRW